MSIDMTSDDRKLGSARLTQLRGLRWLKWLRWLTQA